MLTYLHRQFQDINLNLMIKIIVARTLKITIPPQKTLGGRYTYIRKGYYESIKQIGPPVYDSILN